MAEPTIVPPPTRAATEDDPRWLEYVRLDKLVPNPRNPKGHALDDIRASIERFGYVTPIVVDERTGMMGEGHGRAEALEIIRRAGDAMPPGLKADQDGMWQAPLSRGWSSPDDAEADAFLAGSNQLVMAGGWDDRKLLEILSRTEETPLGLMGTGFSDEDVQAMRRALAAPKQGKSDPDDIPAPPAETITKRGDLWILGGYTTCPKCNHENPVGAPG